MLPLHAVADTVCLDAARREGVRHHISVLSAPSLRLGPYLLGRWICGEDVVIRLHFDDIRPDIRNGGLTCSATGQDKQNRKQ